MVDRHIGRSPAAQFRVGFWDSPTRQAASTEDIVLLIYCLLGPYRKPAGLYQWSERLAAAQIGWDPPQLRQVAERLEAKGAVYMMDGWVWVATWWDHNSSPGPGIYQSFGDYLADAPQALLDRWHQDAVDRGLPVELWMSGGTGGGTPPPTPPTTQGGSGVKQQRVKGLTAAAAASAPVGIAAAALKQEAKRKHPVRTGTGIESWYPSEDAAAELLERTVPHHELVAAVASVKRQKNRSGNAQSPVPALVSDAVESARNRASQAARRPAVAAERISPETIDKGIEACAGYLRHSGYQAKGRAA